jgi:acyl carrier protein
MAVTAADIIAVMRDAGIDEEILDKLHYDEPLLYQGLDSIDMPVIAIAAEKKFGIDLSNASPTSFRTLNDFVDFVNQKVGVQRSA